MADVVLEGLRKTYPGNVDAVKGASLAIADREFVVLVGPSGCGKSTTLRMIAGLEEITAGEIRIDGQRVNEVAPKDRDIAMVFQNYALYPQMSVRENMAFGLKMRRVAKAEIDTRVQEAAEILGITDLLDRKPRALSGGQRQRVAVGRAIVRDPKVFLFDEPLSNLDAKLRVQMRGELVRLHRQLNATMIYVTHDQVEAMTMGDRIVIMREGEIQQVAPPLEIYQRPANRFVAEFIGSPPMNLIDGQLQKVKGSGQFVSDNGAIALPVDFASPTSLQPGPYTLGLRPEDIALGSDVGGNVSINGVVEVVESMGAETIVHLAVGDARLAMRLRGDCTVPGEGTVTCSIDMARAHFFEGASGTRIDYKGG